VTARLDAPSRPGYSTGSNLRIVRGDRFSGPSMAATHTDLRIWTGDASDAPDEPPSAAERLYLREAFRGPPRKGVGEPYLLPWFEQVERQRYSRHGYWIPKVLEFHRHAGETLLGLGEGLGTDWLQYARHGTTVLACSPSQEQLGLIRKNFELRGQAGRFLHAPPHALPIDAASIDVVCIQGLLHEMERPSAMIEEVYRVLRPGGKVIVVAPAKYDATFWCGACFPWRLLFRGSRPADAAKATTGRALRREFAKFVEHRVYKRHLRRSNLPQVWRVYPLPIMERLLGQMLVMKAFKPLSAALAAAPPMAA
jgi:ubiquinone/menaquinone biosynthesis C-methylase UbiE